MTTFKMPKPVAEKRHYPHMHMVGPNDGGVKSLDELRPIAVGEKLYDLQALRDVLEQAEKKIESIEMPADEDNFEAGIMYAVDAIRALKEQVK